MGESRREIAPIPAQQAEARDRATLEWFAGRMLAKLRTNRDKRPWTEADVEFLYTRLWQEVNELKEALLSSKSPDRVVEEAADLANVAMMIAGRARGGVPA